MSQLFDEAIASLTTGAYGLAMAKYLDKGAPVQIHAMGDIKEACERLERSFPSVTVAYAMKADPHEKILKTVRDSGFTAEINNGNELHLARRMGFDPRTLIFSNPHRTQTQIDEALSHGVTLFVSQNEEDLANLAKAGKGKVRVIVRLLSGNATGSGFDIDGDTPAEAPRYGLPEDETVRLLVQCHAQGLIPYGICGHVGTQVQKPEAWDNLIHSAARVEETLRTKHGITLEMLDLGGGFPHMPADPHPPIEVFGGYIMQQVSDAFRNRPEPLKLTIEPGTYIANHQLHLGMVLGAERRGKELYLTTTLGKYNAGMLGDDRPLIGILAQEGERLVSRQSELEHATLFGAVTAHSDRWRDPMAVPSGVKAGDIIVVEGGAYASAARNHWSLQPQPKVFALEQGNKLEDLFRTITQPNMLSLSGLMQQAAGVFSRFSR